MNLGLLQLTDGSEAEEIVGRTILPADVDPLYSVRKLKPYNQQKLMYAMTAATNGPHITSGIPNEVTPKRGVLNNDRPLHYIDVNYGQELDNCSATLFVSCN